MSFSHKQAANAIAYYARNNRIDPIALMEKASELNLEAVLRAGKNNPQVNVQVPENLKELGKMLAETNIQQRPDVRQAVDKTTQTVGV